MRDVIEATAGISQSALLAQVRVTDATRVPADASRGSDSGVGGVERNVQAPQAPVKSKRSDAETSGDRQNASASDQPAKTKAARSTEAQQDEAVKVDIRDFDVGKSPAEVVGTKDLVQRFDENADGRIDQFESQSATRARDDSSTYGGRAAIAEIGDAPTVSVSSLSAPSANASSNANSSSNSAPKPELSAVATRLGTPTAPDLPQLDGAADVPFESAGASNTGSRAAASPETPAADSALVSVAAANVPAPKFGPQAEKTAYEEIVGDDKPVVDLPGERRFEDLAAGVAGNDEPTFEPRTTSSEDDVETGEPRKLFDDAQAQQKLFGDDVAAETKLFGDAAEVSTKLYGGDVTESAKIYGNATVGGAKLYGGEAVEESKLYGDDAVADAKLYGDEAVEDTRLFGDDLADEKLYSDEEIAEQLEADAEFTPALPGTPEADEDELVDEEELERKLYDDSPEEIAQRKLYAELGAYAAVPVADVTSSRTA